MKRKDLIEKLKEGVEQSQWQILKKVLKLPVRVLFPKLLENTRSSYAVIVKTFWGGKLKVILPEAVSTHLYRFGFFDSEVCYYMIDALEEGNTFIDIGAHFGSFSLLGSYLVGETGRVISIDPTPSTFNLLKFNLEKFAPHNNYSTYNIALYDKEGKTSFYDFGLNKSAYNSILGSRDSAMKDTDGFKIEVSTRTLDKIVEEIKPSKIDFIKIDAESAELAILKGGSETLRKFSPKITVEIGDTGLQNAPKSIEIISLLLDYGYKAFEIRGDTLLPHQLLQNYQKEALNCYNLLFSK